MAVVGAGFAGLIAALELKRAGRHDIVVLERGAGVGGVWRDNAYPGAACDIRSHLYSIASVPEAGWSRSYARQPEILAYLQRTAARGGLERHLRLSTEVREAVYGPELGGWRLRLAEGDALTVRSLILATGPVNRATIPPIPGLERFAGEVMHSSAWRSEVALAGRRVAVVGTGASAVQIVPAIAQQVAALTVVQRSGAWVMPRMDRAITPLERLLFRRLPGARAVVRQGLFWSLEALGLAVFGRRRAYRLLERIARAKLRREVADPALRARLTPAYALGCKRLTVSDDYLPAFSRTNVRLCTGDITGVEADGLVTTEGKVAADVIVFATGFTVADADGILPVVGAGGETLAELWTREGAQAHMGVTVAGFPNLAMLLGPNSGLSYSSVIGVVEAQMDYLRAWLDARDRAGPGAALDPRPEVQAVYNAELQRRLADTLWNAGCPSWYIDRTGRNTVIYPGLMSTYRRRLKRFDASDYRLA